MTLDIGVSSMQLDQAERGFSFQGDGPLDMRMSQEGQSAADFLNDADEAEIADVLFHYGEEPKSRRVARAIVAARPIERTGELADVVRKALGHHPGMKKDPATRTFQAIRIHVNEELAELEGGLAAAEQVLAPGGRLAVVTFHSLEDRIVKRFLKARSGALPAGSRHLPAAQRGRAPAPTFEAVAQAGPRRRGRDRRQSPRPLRDLARRAPHRGPPWADQKKEHRDDRQGFQAGRLGRRLRRRRFGLLHALAAGRLGARRSRPARAARSSPPSRDIRTLQTEVGTRGRIPQLEQWNEDVLALAAPAAGQFVAANVSLARFDMRARPSARAGRGPPGLRRRSAAPAPRRAVQRAVAAPAPAAAPQAQVRRASLDSARRAPVEARAEAPRERARPAAARSAPPPAGAPARAAPVRTAARDERRQRGAAPDRIARPSRRAPAAPLAPSRAAADAAARTAAPAPCSTTARCATRPTSRGERRGGRATDGDACRSYRSAKRARRAAAGPRR